ncbi:S41 family peptidase [Parapedobacter sp. DT-150]|uniref:S41 family peptidase n=1 Tax=Parapedobacter sp. DT-150 TaxID=3396162 RepID=UPI003F1DF0C7
MAIGTVIILLLSAFAAVKDDLFLISKNLDIFSAVYRQISLNYVDETDPNRLVKTAVDAMLGGLDPYTEYVQENEVEDYRLRYIDTRYGGIGAGILQRDGHFYLSELHPGRPADEAGLQTGDELVSIDGIGLMDKSLKEVSHLLRGAANSEIRLGVRKPGQEEMKELTIARAIIRQPNVSHATVLSGGIGYIKLDKFLEQSAKEVADALQDFQKNGKLNGLVLDLRNNGGGIVQEAVKIVNLFVPQGELVVSQRGKNSTKEHSYRTMANPLAPELPLVVLINGYSASAAEIVAGAMQDLDRAVIVGGRSFGKGLVQQTFPVPYNNLVKVTIAKYYTPSGRCIQAMDFVHRDDQGGYHPVSDSLINAFNTKSGRVVYDGSGIYPDITMEPSPASPITKALLDRYLVFDYATAFKQKHTRIADANRFALSDEQYADFIQFLEGKDYNYFTETETLVKQLKAQAEADEESVEILQELESLERKLYHNKQHDLVDHQDEIRAAVSEEIISRYYYKNGRMTFSLRRDPQLQRALRLLTTAAEYYSILAGEGKYKTIGRPETLLASVETAD